MFYKTTLLKILFIVSVYLTEYSTFVREIGNTNKAMLPWLFAQKGKYNKMCCPLEPIRPSPAQVYLRKNTLISDTFLPKKSPLFMHSTLTNNGNSLCLFHGRQHTGTSVNFSSPWVQMVKIRPSGSVWENTKVDPALLLGPMTRATSQWRPKGWCASFRSSSGISIWLSKSRTLTSWVTFFKLMTTNVRMALVNQSLSFTHTTKTGFLTALYDKHFMIYLFIVPLAEQHHTLCTVLKLMRDTGSSWLCEQQGLKKPWL